MIHAERATGDYAGGEAGREIAEQLAAIIVDPAAGPDHNFIIECLRTPRHTDPGSKPPLPARQSGLAYAFGGKLGVVAGDDEAVRGDGIARCVIGVQRRVKVVKAAVFLRKAAIPIETQSRCQTQVGTEL